MQGLFCHYKENKNGWLPHPVMDEYEKELF
jgi:hypothetical protein